MKKVGIVTLNGGTNYGNKLQNYALQAVLLSLGYEPLTLQNRVTKGIGVGAQDTAAPTGWKRYRYAARCRLHYRFHLKNTKTGLITDGLYALVHRAEIRRAQQKRMDAFAAFERESLRFAPEAIEDEAASGLNLESYGAFISGSDQVFNPTYRFTSGVSFLQFAPMEKRIAYAPSFGVAEIPQTLAAQYAAWLSSFAALSVREEQGARLIAQLCGRQAPVVADPTMLLSAAQWREFARKPENVPQKRYVLTYFLGDIDRRYWKAICALAEKRGCEIVNLLDIKQPQYYTADPRAFVYLIEHAEYVCTDSYHGTVFAAMLERPFTVFERMDEDGNMTSRFQTLFHELGLRKRIFCGHADFGELPPYAIREKLDALRRESLCYLQQALARSAQKGTKTE